MMNLAIERDEFTHGVQCASVQQSDQAISCRAEANYLMMTTFHPSGNEPNMALYKQLEAQHMVSVGVFAQF